MIYFDNGHLQELLEVVTSVLGKEASADEPLMEAGLDSIGMKCCSISFCRWLIMKKWSELPELNQDVLPSSQAYSGNLDLWYMGCLARVCASQNFVQSYCSHDPSSCNQILD